MNSQVKDTLFAFLQEQGDIQSCLKQSSVNLTRGKWFYIMQKH